HNTVQTPIQQQVVVGIRGGEVDIDLDDLTTQMEDTRTEVRAIQDMVRDEVQQAVDKLEKSARELHEINIGRGSVTPEVRSEIDMEERDIIQPCRGNEEQEIDVQITGKMLIKQDVDSIASRTRSRERPTEEGIEHAIFHQAPLLVRQGRQPEYQPWSHGDMSAIIAKLPPITSGGGRWLSKLTVLCHGTHLALGDVRCLMGQILTTSQVIELERNAQLTKVTNEIPFNHVKTKLSNALRQSYPTPPTVYQNVKFRIKPGETGAAYYFRCCTEWEQTVEENSLNNPVTRDIFRAAVMAGAPNGVKQTMENNPDIPVANNEVWERHLVHHTDRAVEKTSREDEELEKVKAQLLKLQLEKAKGETAAKKVKQMPQYKPPRVGPNSAPQDMSNPTPHPPQYGPQTQAWGQGYQSRPWGNNRGGRGSVGRGMQRRFQCYLCGSPEHLIRDCPQRQGGYYDGPPAGEWDPQRGGIHGGRGRGPQTSYNPRQQLPPSSNLQAPMHPTWGPEGGAEDC
ncbi:MAG: hypothetical protein ACRCW5_09825, partial [Cetobacterium sp.]|uniref:hypothetical protein n=1 Tax=Cetobacterium sp. TaxID=2071632 RepID=UPI003F2C42E8